MFLELIGFDCVSKSANCVFNMVDLTGKLKDALPTKPIFLGFVLTHDFIKRLDLSLKYCRYMLRNFGDFSVEQC